jgi:D-glycero-alpha-D-manno-heptose 1-phosphate guanylyltransferase
MRQPGAGDLKAVLLVGGLGTRLRPVVNSLPKPLAHIGKQPFLELLVLQLRTQGIRRFVMCTGYLGELIEKRFGDGRSWDVEIEYSKEATPQGTAGAIKLAEPYLRGATEFLVMNGDSFLEADLQQLTAYHRKRGGIASVAVVRVDSAGRFGTVQMDGEGRVVGFAEKTGLNTGGVVNGGVYVFNSALLEHIPNGPASLERDVIPKILNRGVFGLRQDGLFIDIGTPEEYARAQVLYDALYEKASPQQSCVASEDR